MRLTIPGNLIAAASQLNYRWSLCRAALQCLDAVSIVLQATADVRWRSCTKFFLAGAEIFWLDADNRIGYPPVPG